ncbi:MAG TPA: HAD family hydrolase [Steroidobacteraceae bacterium]|nr:HAD family hydrolase [Steroidobacteraceae bacterium]
MTTRLPSSLQMVGFDADDTLWNSEIYFQRAHAEFEKILGGYINVSDVRVHDRLLNTERVNIQLFGYGAKGMTLSMVETAVALTDARITGADIHRIVELGKGILRQPVELLPGVREAVTAVAARYRIVMITKGDLFHQERKVAESGLAGLFHRIEIVSEKDQHSYARLLREFEVPAGAFAMVGNSLKSDIAPVLALGGWGVHVPYHITWDLEHAELDTSHPRLAVLTALDQVPAALERFSAS